MILQRIWVSIGHINFSETLAIASRIYEPGFPKSAGTITESFCHQISSLGEKHPCAVGILMFFTYFLCCDRHYFHQTLGHEFYSSLLSGVIFFFLSLVIQIMFSVLLVVITVWIHPPRLRRGRKYPIFNIIPHLQWPFFDRVAFQGVNNFEQHLNRMFLTGQQNDVTI